MFYIKFDIMHNTRQSDIKSLGNYNCWTILKGLAMISYFEFHFLHTCGYFCIFNLYTKVVQKQEIQCEGGKYL